MKRMWQALRDDLRPNTVRGRLVRTAATTAALKIGATLLAFGASLLYARALGPHGYGVYAYVMAWIAVITLPAGLGLPQYLLREGAKLPETITSLRRWADGRLLISGLIASTILLSAELLNINPSVRLLFVIASPMPLLTNLSGVRTALLQARGWIARSQWPQLILAPLSMLIILSGLWLWSGALHPVDLISANLLAGLLPLLINGAQLRTFLKNDGAQPGARRSLKSALPFMWLGSIYLLLSRTDLIMLGFFRGAHDAGVYAVAARMADLVAFFMGASNTAIAPKIAQLYNSGQHDLLQRLLSGSSRRILLVSTPAAILFVFTANPLLSLLFGPAYAAGANVLRILALTHLLYIAGGPLGYVLDMTGLEHLHLRSVAAAVTINILLNLFLIPSLGTVGAATATAVSIAFARVTLLALVRHYRGLRPSGFGF